MTRLLFVVMLVVSVGTAAAQQSVISGQVLDAAGRPVDGLSVTAMDPLSSAGAVGTRTAGDGTFNLTVSAGIYIVSTAIPPPPLAPSYVRVDARQGNVSGVPMRLSAQTPLVPDEPPRVALIQVSAPGATGEATVTGAAGAVAPGSFLILVTLDTGDTVTTQAANDGSFHATTFAPLGASVLIKADPFGLAYRSATGAFAGNDSGPQLSLLAGTIVSRSPSTHRLSPSARPSREGRRRCACKHGWSP